MKKVFLILSCTFSIFLISCASKQSVEEENLQNAPKPDEIELSENEDSNINVDSESSSTDDEILSIKEEFAFLDEIIEPEVITLEPSEINIEETDSESSDDDKTNEEEQAELVEQTEIELPELLETTKTTKTELNESTNKLIPNTNEDAHKINLTSEDSTAEDLTSADQPIDITDDDENIQIEEKLIEEIAEKEIIPSSSVQLKRSEYLDVVYPGNGWIFMGLTDGSKDLTYNGRKLGTGQTKFTLQAKKAGIKIIHFYKEDNLTGEILDDYIEVEVLNENGSAKNHILAPEYKLPIQKKKVADVQKEDRESTLNEKNTETVETVTKTNAPTAKTSTVEPNSTPSAPKASETAPTVITEKTTQIKEETSSSPEKENNEELENVDPIVLLKEAQVLYNESEYSAANKKLDAFFEVATTKLDEGYFLRGQILEAKSNIRDIKAALNAYTTLTKNYPASKYWDEASKRIIYLKRFYLEVR